MGYTRYWEIKKQLDTEKFGEYSKTCQIVCQAWEEEQISKGNFDAGIAGWDGYGEPVFEGSDICFNGCNSDEDLAHETFSIGILSTGFNFCKTARKPYDKQVEACLYLAKYFFGESIKVSDNDSNEESDIIQFVKSFLRDKRIDSIIK